MNQVLLKNLTWDQIYINWPKKKVLIFSKDKKELISKTGIEYFQKHLQKHIK